MQQLENLVIRLLWVFDPTKVTRSALQNAASVAGLMITTEAMVAELPADDDDSHGHSHGGGVGGPNGRHGRHGRHGRYDVTRLCSQKHKKVLHVGAFFLHNLDYEYKKSFNRKYKISSVSKF